MISNVSSLISRFAAGCASGSSFLGFHPWFYYLPSINDQQGRCIPQITKLVDVWLIVAAIIDTLLRVAGIAAVAMLVYGGFRYISANGNPEHAAKAQHTILNALIGLIVAVAAVTLVQFLAGRFTG